MSAVTWRRFLGTLICSLLVFASLLAFPQSSVCSDPYEEEPPTNPFLIESPWSASHRNSYCQASSPLPGPVTSEGLTYKHKYFGIDIPITLTFSSEYPDGKRVIWASTVTAVGQTRVFKFDCETLKIIDVYDPVWREGAPFKLGASMSGAYCVLDSEGHFFTPSAAGCGIDRFSDANPNLSTSKIVRSARFLIPDDKLCRPSEEKMVGMTMTYDGKIAFVTNLGTAGVLDRDLSCESARYLSLNDDAPPDAALDELEQVSNSIAADEVGGVYIVTDQLMYRVQWTGTDLTLEESKGAWSANYETGSSEQAGRLGKGCGSTPSLMGTGDQDRFVVITDGQELMHLVLLWKDDIPADWEGLPGKDRRIAAEVPVRFGNPKATKSYSEQSVLVRGYGAVVVNNSLNCRWLNALPPRYQPFAMLLSNIPWIAPYGIEKFEWNPATMELESVWANRSISLPNAIPCMSSETGLIYSIGQRYGRWTLEAIDWQSGRSVFRKYVSPWPWDNSFYAGTEVGPDSSIFTGTLGGITRFKPAP